MRSYVDLSSIIDIEPRLGDVLSLLDTYELMEALGDRIDSQDMLETFLREYCPEKFVFDAIDKILEDDSELKKQSYKCD